MNGRKVPSGSAPLTLPRLYVILDAATLKVRGLDLRNTVSELLDAGVLLMQYRDKLAADTKLERQVDTVLEALHGSECRLILNDDPQTAHRTGCHGVHLGQGDAAPAIARSVMGAAAIIGLSTHTPQQIIEGDRSMVDYLAIGPVLPTASKANHEPTVGLAGVRSARSSTQKPLVAIGGISLQTIAAVLDAGGNSAAVIGAVYRPGQTIGQNARDLLRAASGHA